MSRNKDLIKNTMILSIGQFVPKVMSLIVLPILTTCLTKFEYGLYDLTLTVASFCIPLITLQIQQAVFRFLLETKDNKAEVITSSFSFLIVMYSFFSIGIIFFWNNYINNFLLSLLFSLSYFVESILSLLGQISRGLGYNIKYSLAYAIYSISFMILLCLKYFLFSYIDLDYLIVSMIISYLISILYLFYTCKIWKYINLKYNNIFVLKKLIGFSGPMVISSIALWVVNLSDRFCISAFLGLEMNALYSVANKIPNLINSFYSVFNLAWTENTSKLTLKEKRNGYYTVFFDEFFNFLIGIVLIIISAMPFIFEILINAKYNQAYGLMSWIFIGVFFSSLVSFLGSIYVGEKKTKEVGISSILGAIFNLVINLLFMKRFGVLVAVFSTIISYFVIFIYRLLDLKNYIVIEYRKNNIICGILLIVIIALINQYKKSIITVISIVITIFYNLRKNKKIINVIYNKIFRKE